MAADRRLDILEDALSATERVLRWLEESTPSATATPMSARSALPGTIELVQRKVDPKDLTEYEGIPATTIARALIDCRGLVMDERLADAAREATRRGLLPRRDAGHRPDAVARRGC